MCRGANWPAGVLTDIEPGHPSALVLGLAFCVLLVVVTLTDLARRTIPNVVLASGGIVALSMVAMTDAGELGARAIAAAGAGGFLLLITLAYPRGMGMGDVKLAGVMGIYLGRAVAPALVIGFAAGALAGIVMVARRGPAARKSAIPFAPFLALGGMLALWLGNAMVDWYLDAFLRS